MDVRVVFILTAVGIVQCKLIDSCSETKTFVDRHNARRLELAKSKVPGQPPASNMTYLIWDEELATKAANWASTRTYGHNPDRTVPSGKFVTGENIYRFSITDKNYKFDPELAMEYWWNEYKDFTYRALSESDFGGPKQIGHYTQMAWANTVRLGCATYQYFENEWNYFYVVCNYGPAGNIMGHAPYKSDEGPSGHLVCGESNCNQKYGDKC